MAQDILSRRDMLRGTVGTTAGFLLAGQGLAQPFEPLQVIEELNIPPELSRLPLPSKALDILRLITAIVALERDADLKRLPESVLAFGRDAELPTSEADIYRAALPRLVALIDRAELGDLKLAERAAGLLAELHSSQHVVADGWKEVVDRAGESDQASRPHHAALVEWTGGSPASGWKGLSGPSVSRDFKTLRPEYAKLFGTARVRPEFSSLVEWHTKALQKFRPRYEAVGKDVSVPWYFIGAIHCLESSLNFRAHLHNGDYPLTARTRQVPKGRPLLWLPPTDWESSAKDALRLLGFAGQTDWSLERTLYRLEAYNGFGYRRRVVPTPYLWSFSNHYDRGKYASDGAWSAQAKSQQCGAAVMLRVLADAGQISLSPASAS